MAGTNNLYDKNKKRLMGPVDISDEMYSIWCKNWSFILLMY